MEFAAIVGIAKAGIDIELLVWLVVVGFTLISQMAKAARQKPGQRRPPARRPGETPPVARRAAAAPHPTRAAPAAPPRRPTVTDAQKELEDFLATLAGQPPPHRREPEPDDVPEELVEPQFQEVAPQPPPPPPPPPRAVTRPRSRVIPKPASPMVIVNRETVRVDRPELPSATEVLSETAAAISGLEVDPYASTARATTTAQDLRQLRASLKQDLQTPESLRKAMVLREILDAPLALRQSRPIGC